MKSLLKWGIFSMMYWLAVVNTSATNITNVRWAFPNNITSEPSPPMGPGLSIYSPADSPDWIAASRKLSVSFVPNLGEGPALEFSYNGNHPDYLNDTILMLTSTVSGLPRRSSLTSIKLSYDSKWNMTGNTVTETWAYSLNGGAFKNFETDAVTGNLWQTEGSILNGIILNNGDTIALRDTISGADGSNGKLKLDDIQLTSILMLEPSSTVLASFGGLAALVAIRRLRS
jgi:hypothetical protein